MIAASQLKQQINVYEGADFTPHAALAAWGLFITHGKSSLMKFTFIDVRFTSGLLNQSKGFINFG